MKARFEVSQMYPSENLTEIYNSEDIKGKGFVLDEIRFEIYKEIDTSFTMNVGDTVVFNGFVSIIVERFFHIEDDFVEYILHEA